MIPSISAPRRSPCSPSSVSRSTSAGHLGAPSRTGHVQRQHLVAERRLRGREHAVVVGARLVELGDHHGAGHPDLGTLPPQRARWRRRRASLAAITNSAQSAARSPARTSPTKSAYPGVSTKLILVSRWTSGRDGQRDGAFVRLLGLLEVADRRALLDRPRAGDGSGGGEQRLDQGGLPGPSRSDQHHVADPVGAARPEILARLLYVRPPCPPCLPPGVPRGGRPDRRLGIDGPNNSSRRRMSSRDGDPRGATGPAPPDRGEPLAAWGQRGAQISSGC